MTDTLEMTRAQAKRYEALRQAAEDLPRLEQEHAEEQRLAALQEQLEAAEADLAARAERFRLALHRSNVRLTGALRELQNILAERARIEGGTLLHQARAVAGLQWQANGGKVHKHNTAEVQTLIKGQAEQSLIDLGAWPVDCVYHPPGDVNVGDIAEDLSRVPVRIPRQETWAEIVGHNGEVIKERIA